MIDGLSSDTSKIYGNNALKNNASTSPVFNPFVMPFFDFDCMDASMNQFQQTMKMFDMLMNDELPKGSGAKSFNKDFNTCVLPKFYIGPASNSHSKVKADSKIKTKLTSLNAIYNPELSNKLANIAYDNAMATDTIGKCYREIKDTLVQSGLDNGKLTGGSAFEAADKLANHKNFREVVISKNDLKDLPAGCVIVWQASEGHEHGHIAVTLGDGKEASDHVQNLVIRDADYSVFVPVGINKLS